MGIPPFKLHCCLSKRKGNFLVKWRCLRGKKKTWTLHFSFSPLSRLNQTFLNSQTDLIVFYHFKITLPKVLIIQQATWLMCVHKIYTEDDEAEITTGCHERS